MFIWPDLPAAAHIQPLTADTGLASIHYPESFLTDNGLIFGAHHQHNTAGNLELELLALGIRSKHSRPYHPQTCGKVERFQCATMRAVVSPAQPGGTRREVSGSDGLPKAERLMGTRACQETRGRAQAYGPVLWGTRVTGRKLDCLNPNLQEMEVHIRRKDARNRRQPCGGLLRAPPQLPGPGAMPSEGIEGDEWDAYLTLPRTTVTNVGSPTGREPHGDGGPVVVAGVTPGQGGRESRPQGKGGQVIRHP